MQIRESEAAPDAVAIALAGRLDSPGVDEIETAFTSRAVDAGRHVLVDLSEVEFLGSMGIRMLITVAKAVARRKCRLVLFAPQPLVRQVFDTVSLDDIVPVRADRPAALEAARA